MRVIDRFAEEVFFHDGSFSINENKKYYHFMQDKVLKATYVYGFDQYEDEGESRLDNKAELVAIISNNIIYVVDEFLFDVWKYNGQFNLPENVVLFYEYVKSMNKHVREDIFEAFYDDLEIENANKYVNIKTCENKARECLLYSRDAAPEPNLGDLFSARDVARSLCGFITIQDEAMKRLSDKKEIWMAVKAEQNKIDALMEEKSVVEDWELSIALGLKDIDAKFVTVEFEMNDKSASGKVKLEALQRKLNNKDNFDGWDFDVRKRGEELIKSMGAATWKCYGEVLTCKHISKITYGKKELYKR